MGLSNVFLINHNLIVTDKYKETINDVLLDEPIINRLIQILITRNNTQYTRFIFHICKDELIYRKIDNIIVDMYKDLNYSYFSYVTLKIDWAKNINRNTTKSLVVEDNIIDVVELCFPHIIFKYNNNRNRIMKFVFDPNINMYIIDCDIHTIKSIKVLKQQHEVSSYVSHLYANYMNNVSSVNMKSVLLFPSIHTKHIIHNTYKKSTLSIPTHTINWINAIEYHEVQIDENGLMLGNSNENVGYTIDTKIKEMIDCDDEELENITNKVINNFIILITLNENLVWYLISH